MRKKKKEKKTQEVEYYCNINKINTKLNVLEITLLEGRW